MGLELSDEEKQKEVENETVDTYTQSENGGV